MFPGALGLLRIIRHDSQTQSLEPQRQAHGGATMVRWKRGWRVRRGGQRAQGACSRKSWCGVGASAELCWLFDLHVQMQKAIECSLSLWEMHVPANKDFASDHEICPPLRLRTLCFRRPIANGGTVLYSHYSGTLKASAVLNVAILSASQGSWCLPVPTRRAHVAPTPRDNRLPHCIAHI